MTPRAVYDPAPASCTEGLLGNIVGTHDALVHLRRALEAQRVTTTGTQDVARQYSDKDRTKLGQLSDSGARVLTTDALVRACLDSVDAVLRATLHAEQLHLLEHYHAEQLNAHRRHVERALRWLPLPRTALTVEHPSEIYVTFTRVEDIEMPAPGNLRHYAQRRQVQVHETPSTGRLIDPNGEWYTL